MSSKAAVTGEEGAAGKALPRGRLRGGGDEMTALAIRGRGKHAGPARAPPRLSLSAGRAPTVV